MRWVAALVLAIALAGCSGDEKKEEPGLSGTCGLRQIAKQVDEEKVSEEFFLEGVELARTQDIRRGGSRRFIATINAPYSVDDAYNLYLDQVKEAGWDIVQHETEGFEAEIYLSDKDHLAAVQIRTSTCEKKSVVYVSVVDQ